MKRSVDRILTTHTGSLPRPQRLVELMFEKEQGHAVDAKLLADTVRDCVREVVEHELELIFDGRKTVEDGLDRAVIRGNAILRAFAATNKPWPGEI